ncbi:radical SAM protein, partial [Candidatus Sumerlaeota bacterium]|nr:radical SAM protein [Candidatus Sumerlaeota bacterium]
MRQIYFLPEQCSFARRLYLRWVERRRPRPDFPRIIQIQTRPGCPSRCIFCPNGRTITKIPNVAMPMDLYQRIIDECFDHEVERVSPYLMCEPLIDPQIGERIAYAVRRRALSGSKGIIKINSNGYLLDEEKAKSLLDSGLDRLNFSVHGIVPEIYEQTMVGLKLERVLKNIDRFLELKRAG